MITIDHLKLGEILLYGGGALFSLTIPPAIATFVTMTLRKKLDEKKADKRWNDAGQDRRNGHNMCQAVNGVQGEHKSKLNHLFNVEIPRITANAQDIAVIKTQLQNILEGIQEIKIDLRNRRN